LARIGVTRKQIGWHSFRHSLATNLRFLGVDIKVAQELMRHSGSRTTLDVYTRAIDQQKREASLEVMELMLPLDLQKFQHPSAPSGEPRKKRRCRKFMSRKEILVDLIGIEPMTSSMPWKRAPSCATGPQREEPPLFCWSMPNPSNAPRMTSAPLPFSHRSFTILYGRKNVLSPALG
jgi:Phage integrase family